MGQEFIEILGVVQGTREQHDVVLAGDVTEVRVENVDSEFLRRSGGGGIAVDAGDLVTQVRQSGGQGAAAATGLENARRGRGQERLQVSERVGHRDGGQIHLGNLTIRHLCSADRYVEGFPEQCVPPRKHRTTEFRPSRGTGERPGDPVRPAPIPLR